MQKRDLFKDEIEKLSKALAKILSEFLQLKTTGNNIEVINQTNIKLQQELHINIDEVIQKTKEDLLIYIKNKKLTANHIDILTRILVEQADIFIQNGDNSKAKNYLTKSVELLEAAGEIFKTISFQHITLINNLKSKLNTL
jgi:sugar-specific transcriptional regulator TrmB